MKLSHPPIYSTTTSKPNNQPSMQGKAVLVEQFNDIPLSYNFDPNITYIYFYFAHPKTGHESFFKGSKFTIVHRLILAIASELDIDKRKLYLELLQNIIIVVPALTNARILPDNITPLILATLHDLPDASEILLANGDDTNVIALH